MACMPYIKRRAARHEVGGGSCGMRAIHHCAARRNSESVSTMWRCDGVSRVLCVATTARRGQPPSCVARTDTAALHDNSQNGTNPLSRFSSRRRRRVAHTHSSSTTISRRPSVRTTATRHRARRATRSTRAARSPTRTRRRSARRCGGAATSRPSGSTAPCTPRRTRRRPARPARRRAAAGGTS